MKRPPTKTQESIKRFEEILREEAREMLTGYLKDGTEYRQHLR
jgi:hypothetical protein